MKWIFEYAYMKGIRLLIIIFFSFLTVSANAQGDLLVTPTRVVFEGKKVKQDLTIANMGSDTVGYSVSFLHYLMKENGLFIKTELEDSGVMFADQYLRVYPRYITLAPYETQVVQIQVRKKTGMAEGEYRSHLYFRSENKRNKVEKKQQEGIDTNIVSINLIPVYGMTIPVIIRQGEHNLNVELKDLSFRMQSDTIPFLEFVIQRSGNISVFGDLKVEFLLDNGRYFEVGLLRGVAVYTNLDKRRISMRLNPPDLHNRRPGKIRLTYFENLENGYSKEIAVTELVM